MADISKITLPDSSEYNIKDAGALRIGGTAVAAKKLESVHALPSGVEGVWKFLEISMQYVAQQTMVLSIDSNFSSSCGLLRIHTKRISNEVFQEIGWIASGKSHPNVRWKYSDSKWNLYLLKSSLETISFHVISATTDSSYTWKLDSVTAEDFLAATVADVYVNLQAASATFDANGDQIDMTYLKKTETAFSSYTLFPTKVYTGSLAAGWYKFAEVNITGSSGRANITFKYKLANSSTDFIGNIFVYKESSIPMNCSIQIPYIVSGNTAYFRYNIDSTTKVSLYVYKHDFSGYPVFTILTSQNELGEYLDPSTYMLESLVAETPPATALKPYYSSINRWIYNVPVSPGTNQQILSYSHNIINASTILAKVEFANPEYIKSDCLWETTDGSAPNASGTITLTGTCTTATTANLLLLNVVVT